MDAIIVAGGRGSRLWPLTKQMPKCMLPVKGKPIVCHQLELLRQYGLNNIIISLGYRGEQISEYLKDGEDFGVRIKYVRESEPLGTGGGIKNCEKAISSLSALVIYGDIFTRLNISRFIEFHANRQGIASIVTHKTDHPNDSDLVETTEDGQIQRIIGKREKRTHMKSGIAKSSVYILNRKVFDYIPKTQNSFEENVLPILVKKEKVFAYLTQEMVRDIGTLDRYQNVSHGYGESDGLGHSAQKDDREE